MDWKDIGKHLVIFFRMLCRLLLWPGAFVYYNLKIVTAPIGKLFECNVGPQAERRFMTKDHNLIKYEAVITGEQMEANINDDLWAAKTVCSLLVAIVFAGTALMVGTVVFICW